MTRRLLLLGIASFAVGGAGGYVISALLEPPMSKVGAFMLAFLAAGLINLPSILGRRHAEREERERSRYASAVALRRVREGDGREGA